MIFSRKKIGFTLVEIMMVITIIAILIAVLYPYITGYFERSRDTQRINLLKTATIGMVGYYNEHSAYPSHDADCQPDEHTHSCMNAEYRPGCFPEKTLEPYMKKHIISPHGDNYDEGCGSNGRFAFGSHSTRMAYILLATMEGKKSGNYQPIGSETLAGFTGSLTEEAFRRAQNNIQEKSGKYYVLSDGYAVDAPPSYPSIGGGNDGSGNDSVGGGYSLPLPTPNQGCNPGTTENGYDYGHIPHGGEIDATKTENIVNGKKKYTAKISCHNGVIGIIQGTEIEVLGGVECNSDAHLGTDGNSCEGNTQKCEIENGIGKKEWNVQNNNYNPCKVEKCNKGFTKTHQNTCIQTTKSCATSEGIGIQTAGEDGTYSYCKITKCQNESTHELINGKCKSKKQACEPMQKDGYNIPKMEYDTSQEVTKIDTRTPVNGQTTTTATATCNNGNIAILPKNTKIQCNENFHIENNACVSNTKSCDISPEHAATSEQTWNANTKQWNACVPTACENGYEMEGNACVSTCKNPVYLHTNGVTIKASECAEAGKEYQFEGETYYVAVDKQDTKNKIDNGYPANRIVTTKLTDMNRMFQDALSFNQPIGNWDVSNVTDMNRMFQDALSFNQPIGNWDVSNVTDMNRMFYGASSFNQPIGNWDVSKVTDMEGMFVDASSFNQPIGNWDVSNVTSMRIMFAKASSFNQPIGNWNTGRVESMAGMFEKMHYFNQPIGNWDVSNVTDMSTMFFESSSFNQPLGRWNTGKVTNMRSMFWKTPFNQPIGNWDVSNVTNMTYMFAEQDSFNQDISRWDTRNVQYMDGMFSAVGMQGHPMSYDLSGWDTRSVIYNEHVEFYHSASSVRGKARRVCEYFAPDMPAWKKPNKCK